MANHCWNNLVIEGKKEVLDKLEELFKNYHEIDYFVDFGNAFFPDLKDPPTREDYNFYGTKWWDFIINRENDDYMEISGDSAWGPPLELIRMIAEKYSVGCTISFSEGGCNFAGVYVYQNDQLIEKADYSCAQYAYSVENGVQSLMDDYLYDDDCFDIYKDADDFIDKLGVEGVEHEDMERLNELFKEYYGPMLDKKQLLTDLKGINEHLKNLGMHGLATKVEDAHAALTKEWQEELKPVENEV
jgi:hypothetical protein